MPCLEPVVQVSHLGVHHSCLKIPLPPAQEQGIESDSSLSLGESCEGPKA